MFIVGATVSFNRFCWPYRHPYCTFKWHPCTLAVKIWWWQFNHPFIEKNTNCDKKIEKKFDRTFTVFNDLVKSLENSQKLYFFLSRYCYCPQWCYQFRSDGKRSNRICSNDVESYGMCLTDNCYCHFCSSAIFSIAIGSNVIFSTGICANDICSTGICANDI